MNGRISYCWQLEPFGWPCLAQAEWASWIQVAAAIVGIGLALYIPVRMKRLEDLERMRSVVARLDVLKGFGARFNAAICSDVPLAYPPKVDIETARSACEALIKDIYTDAAFLKPLGDALETSRVMIRVWENTACRLADQSKEKDEAARIGTELSAAHGQASDILNTWRKKHWLALAFHG